MKILKKIRNNYKLTQEELAQKLSIEPNSISLYESGNFPSFNIITKISKEFNVSIDYLLLNNDCYFPRSFDFIDSAVLIDKKNIPDSIKHIKKTIDILIKEKDLSIYLVKKDIIEIDLLDNFHSNIKLLRNYNNITQQQVASQLKIDRSVVSQYENKSYPSIEKMKKLSGIFNCSIHSLVTGKKLLFNFINKKFEKSIYIADHLLTIEDKVFLIKLMNNM